MVVWEAFSYPFHLNREQEKELRDKVNEMGTDATQMKLAAHMEKMQLMEQYQAREQALLEQMDGMNAQIEAEKLNVNIANELTSRITKDRVELDTQLGVLKKQYAEEQQAHERDVIETRETLRKQADAEKAQLVQKFKQRESELKGEMRSLMSRLEQEKDATIIAKALTNRIMQTRMELDVELGKLKKKYALEMAKNRKEIDRLKAEVEDMKDLKAELNQLHRERNNLGSLSFRALKIILRLNNRRQIN